MGSLVIAVYRPRKGKAKALLEIVGDHVPTLRRLGLVTSREAIVGKAEDGSIIEIFEWVSDEAIDRAHHDPTIQRIWKRINSASDCVSLSALNESRMPFPSFEPLDVTPRIGSVDWVDMTGERAESEKRFYQRVVGLRPVAVDMGSHRDWMMVGANGRPSCGICHRKGPNAAIPPGWVPWFTVESVAKSVAAARRLGATVIDGPRSGSGGTFCIVRDPAGLHAALFQPGSSKPKRRSSQRTRRAN